MALFLWFFAFVFVALLLTLSSRSSTLANYRALAAPKTHSHARENARRRRQIDRDYLRYENGLRKDGL